MSGTAAIALAILAAATSPPPERAAVDELSTRQLVGQRMVFSFAGRTPPPGLVRRIRRNEAAGVILFSRNFSSRRQLRRLTRRLQRAAPEPLLVMIDQEGGLVKRLPGPPGRSAAEMGATGRPRVALREGSATGRSLRGVGVNVDLAPVADVPRRGSFLIGERRAFGRTPGKAGRFAGAFARGLRRARVAATLKHFPGLGQARVNTDHAPVRIRGSLRRDVRAFEIARRRGRPRLVMLATAIYPRLSALPAALSRRIATRRLRAALGDRIVSVSDDLEAASLRGWGGPAHVGVRAARAGTDLLLYAQTYRAGVRAARAIRRAARARRLPRSRLEQSTERVLRLRRGL